MDNQKSRRTFLQNAGFASLGALAATNFTSSVIAGEPAKPDLKVLGEAGLKTAARTSGAWKPVSDRKIRVGIIGYGVCKFGALFGFQDHPNVTVAAVSDLFPDRCAALAKECRCEKTYPSLEELVKDDSIEAVFIATDAPHHAEHAMLALKHGKHVGIAVPAVFGSIDDAHELYNAVKASGRNYMMFETSSFHDDCHAMREIYRSGGFGKIIYAEGEYYHYCPTPIDSYKGWRIGLPPQWYPTHSNAYCLCVTGGSFTEVSCMGVPSKVAHLQPSNNRYKNRFGTEVALFRSSDGGMARMAVSWDTHGGEVEIGRVRGRRGTMWGGPYDGELAHLPPLERPPLPPTVSPGYHGGSHGNLTEEFVRSILEQRKPLVDVALALNLTVSGIVAHQSAIKDGELLKIPQFA